MHETASSLIGAWSNFYVITGSSAGALTGLMFVVITLVAGTPTRTRDEGISTDSTPTVVHFGAALLVSASLSAPGRSLTHAAVLLGLAGIYGVVYVSRVMFRQMRQTLYQPEIDDWVWYTVFPLIAYVAILIAAILLPSFPTETLFALAAANILLIFIGIHNAWDIVTFIAVGHAADILGSSTNIDQAAASRNETNGE